MTVHVRNSQLARPRKTARAKATESTEVAVRDASDVSTARPIVERAPADPALIARARSTPLTRDGIAELARESESALEAALAETLDRRDIKAATALALALAAADRTLDPALVSRLVPDVDQRDLVPSLLRACGDSPQARLDVMRQALERGQLSHDREAIVAFVASQLLGDAPWPAPWPGLLRTLARQRLGTEAGVLLGTVIQRAADSHLTAVGQEWVDLAGRSNAEEISKFWLEGWTQPVLEILPETEPPRVVAGYTVRKAQERPGRNDPCHCGSGKKYKKCHATQDDAQDRVADQPLVDAARVSATDVDGMRIQEVLALPFERLARPALVTAIRQLRAYHRWEDAERALDVLAAMPKEGDGSDVEHQREDLIEEALRMRCLDVLDRQLAKVKDREALQSRVRAGIACARPSDSTVAVLDEQARRGLHGDADAIADVAYALLDHAPALGILVARGALDPEHVEASDTMLDEIELARDRLELPPGDAYGPLYDEWVEGRKAESARSEAEAAEMTRVRAELERAESEVDARQAQVVALEHEIRELRERLDRSMSAVQREHAGMPHDAVAAAYRTAEEHRQRLARKVEEMKSLLAEGNAERASLRERVAELEAARTAASRSDSDSAEIALGPADDGGSSDEATMPVRIPVFDPRAIESLRELQPKTSRQAVSIAGRLASGDRAAWRDVKRMQGMEGVWTARVGIHHRLIFTVDEDQLDVRDVVTREALLTTLERYR